MKYGDSEYNVGELREEEEKVREKQLKAERLGEVNRVAINERKIQIVLSYMLNPEDFKPDCVYTLNNDPGHTFKIDYINGVMAWGYRINLLGETYEEIEAIPLSLLGEMLQEE